MRILSLIFPLLLLTGCTDETFPTLAELNENLLATDGPDLFFATSINFIPRGNFNRDVEFNYAHVYEQLTPEQQNNVVAVLVSTPVRQLSVDLDRTRVYEQNYAVGQDACYTFRFQTPQGLDSRETEICFTVE